MTGDREAVATYADRVLTEAGRLAGRREWIALVELRPMVGGYRPHVDQALRELSRAGRAVLAPAANQKTLTTADRAAAVRLGGEDCHMIAIH